MRDSSSHNQITKMRILSSGFWRSIIPNIITMKDDLTPTGYLQLHNKFSVKACGDC